LSSCAPAIAGDQQEISADTTESGRKGCGGLAMKKLSLILLICSFALAVVMGQRSGGRRGYGFGGGRYYDSESVRTPREITQHGNETPNWTNAPGFERDVFTFLRI